MAPPLVLLPLLEEAPLPEMMQLVIVTAPVLRLKMPPPELASDPRVMVKPDSTTLKLPDACVLIACLPSDYTIDVQGGIVFTRGLYPGSGTRQVHISQSVRAIA